MKAKKDTDSPDLKIFNMRLPKDLWLFLKNAAAAQEIAMSDIIIDSLSKYRKKYENKLTNKNINV